MPHSLRDLLFPPRDCFSFIYDTWMTRWLIFIFKPWFKTQFLRNNKWDLFSSFRKDTFLSLFFHCVKAAYSLITFQSSFADKKIEKLDTDDLDEIEKIANWNAAAGTGIHPAVVALPLKLDQRSDWHTFRPVTKRTLKIWIHRNYLILTIAVELKIVQLWEGRGNVYRSF